MKIDILTLFPEMFKGVFEDSILKRAQESGKVEIRIINFRDYSLDPHHKVDDYGFGGGAGMVLMAQPICDAIESLKTPNSKVLLMTPQGVPYKQQHAYELAKCNHLIIVCGHYEGFDERIRSFVDEEISVGDYVLTGGEIPSMVIDLDLTELIKKLIEGKTMDVSPKLVINNPTKNFYDFKVEDFEIEGYAYNKTVKLGKIPVAE